MQRKLTREELQHANRAAWYLRSVMNHCGLIANSGSVLDYLNAMEEHGTTDGNPYIEQQPEIGDGYRIGTGNDAWRLDLEVWCENKWQKTGPGICQGFIYQVPIDRIPTDEDAKQRPTVMVCGNAADGWHARRLLGVTEMGFLVASGDGFTNWKYARFPYPGELA